MSSQHSKEKISSVRLALISVVTLAFCVTCVAIVTIAVIDVRGEIFPSQSKDTWFAPYVEVAQQPTNYFESQAHPSLKQAVLGTILAHETDPCLPAWGSHYDLVSAARALDLDRRIARFKERGGSALISIGGNAETELASACESSDTLIDAYQSIVERYKSSLDVVLSEAVVRDELANKRRAEALSALTSKYENLEVWVTVPATSNGVSDKMVSIVQDLLKLGVRLEGVNLLVNNLSLPESTDTSMSFAVIQALTAANATLSEVFQREGEKTQGQTAWQRLGVTPMIGQNYGVEQKFSLRDASALVDFLVQKNIKRLSMWSLNRDVSCGTNSESIRPLVTCSGVEQELLEFTERFAVAFPSEHERLASIGADAENNSLQGHSALQQASSELYLSPYPSWQAQAEYTKGDKVVWHGRVYKAKWWNRSHQPDAPARNVWDTPWRQLGPVLKRDITDLAAWSEQFKKQGRYEWRAEKTFRSQEEVTHQNKIFKARWLTQGQEPESNPKTPFDHPWEYLGRLDCEGAGCLEGAVAARLTVDFGGLSGIDLEIRKVGGREGRVGELVYAFSDQDGQKTYEVLRDTYDLVFSDGASQLTMESVDCSSERCTAESVAAILTIDYGGLEDVGTEVRLGDNLEGIVGDLVRVLPRQGGRKSYRILRNQYDLVFMKSSMTVLRESVNCLGGACSVQGLSASLAVDFGKLQNIDMEIRGGDGIPSSTGLLVEEYVNQSGFRTFDVLAGTYDLVFRKGNISLTLDGIDCSLERCGVDGIASELYVDLGGLSANVEIYVDDGRVNSAGPLIEAFPDQTGRRSYALLRGSYDVRLSNEDWFDSYDGVACSSKRCEILATGLAASNIDPVIAALEQKLAELQKRFTNNYPDVVALRRQIEKARDEKNTDVLQIIR